MIVGMRHREPGRFGVGMMALVSILLTLPVIWLMKDMADSLHSLAEKQ